MKSALVICTTHRVDFSQFCASGGIKSDLFALCKLYR